MSNGTDLQSLLDKTQAELQRRQRGGSTGSTAEETTDFTPSPTPSGVQGFDLDLVEEARRQKIRAFVESQPPVLQFLIEAAPATIGTLAGIPGGIPGMIAGGIAGEQIAQESGISLRSDAALALSGAGPLAGPAVGGVVKLSKKAIGTGITVLPPARAALSRNAARKAVDEMEGITTRIFANQQGLTKFEASRLYQIAEKSGVRIPAFRTTVTKQSIKGLRKELNKFSALPEVKQALRLLDNVEEMMKGSTVSFADLIAIRKMVGTALDKAGTASRKLGDVKGAKKLFFKSVADDMEHLASIGGKTGRVGKIAQAAIQRAKLDFAVSDLKKGLAGALEPVEGKAEVILNIKKVRKWLLDRTNPDSTTYNKNMAEALEPHLPEIKESLQKLSRFGAPMTAGGRGSLILRGKGATAGGAIGTAVGGIPGGVVGTFAGAASPEIALAILSFKPAVRFLEKAALLGDGVIPIKAWAIAGQIAAQGAKMNDPQREFDSPDFEVGGG
tara:strand:- start:95 stop:1597 length:1503 start_codon:yes stop_codon:yes gene_type:complete